MTATPLFAVAHTCTLALLLALAAGCASSGPTVSGFALGDMRVVSRGDEVVIHLPGVAETGAARWRITSFDSLMLSLTQRARLEDTPQGGRRWTVRFTARTPGETDVIITRIALESDGGGTLGERRRFQVRILE